MIKFTMIMFPIVCGVLPLIANENLPQEATPFPSLTEDSARLWGINPQLTTQTQVIPDNVLFRIGDYEIIVPNRILAIGATFSDACLARFEGLTSKNTTAPALDTAFILSLYKDEVAYRQNYATDRYHILAVLKLLRILKSTSIEQAEAQLYALDYVDFTRTKTLSDHEKNTIRSAQRLRGAVNFNEKRNLQPIPYACIGGGTRIENDAFLNKYGLPETKLWQPVSIIIRDTIPILAPDYFNNQTVCAQTPVIDNQKSHNAKIRNSDFLPGLQTSTYHKTHRKENRS